MYDKNAIKIVENIKKKIEFINNIVANFSSIDRALEDEQTSRAAILMHLVSIAEQFDRLIKNGYVDILAEFEKEDIKGSYALRNFIAHDYDGVDLYIVEDIIKNRLPIILNCANNILKEN